MARKKTPSVRVRVTQSLSQRLREIRQELFGEHGGPELARRLGLPARNWYNYETGVTVPAEVLLGFIEQTGANPTWLSTGEGPKYNRGGWDVELSGLTPVELLRHALEKLEQVELIAPLSGDSSTADYVALPVIPLPRIGKDDLDGVISKEKILARREWIAHPSQTIAARVPDDAMHPILSAGSIAAIDRSVTDPHRLQGTVVAACPDERPMIRWLELSGRHMILRPNQASREFPIIPIELSPDGPSPIIGPVVCSWNRFRDA